ncbi:hypothetical protein AVEN_25280-1, partial [Araneus ventricosus]
RCILIPGELMVIKPPGFTTMKPGSNGRGFEIGKSWDRDPIPRKASVHLCLVKLIQIIVWWFAEGSPGMVSSSSSGSG